MLRGYIILSRVRSADKILVAQPFAPAMFMQGDVPGPSLLLQVLRNEKTPEQAQKAWKMIREKLQAGGKEKWPASMQLTCWSCKEDNPCKKYLHPLSSFHAHANHE